MSLQRIEQLKRAMVNGDNTPLLEFLVNQATADDLRAIREQKMLTKIHDSDSIKQLADAYDLAAARHFTSAEERRAASTYIDFAKVVSGMFGGFQAEIDKLLLAFEHISLTELVEFAERLLSETVSHLYERFNSKLKTVGHQGEVAAISNVHEHALHAWSARTTDSLFAITRAFNAATPQIRKIDGRCRDKEVIHAARGAFGRLVEVAAWWNSLDYAFDKVSFGEWSVTLIEDGTPPTIQFDDIDPLLTRARHFGLIRKTVHAHNPEGKEDRIVRDKLLHDVRRGVQLAADYFERLFARIEFAPSELFAIEERLASFLVSIDADDDLLVVANPGVVAHFQAAMVLRCFRDVGALAVEKMDKKKRRVVHRPTLDLRAIAECFARDNEDMSALHAALEASTVTLPVRNYLDLVDRPFIRLEDGRVLPMHGFDATSAIDSIRQRCDLPPLNESDRQS